MNRKIKKYRALTIIVLFYLAAAYLMLGPAGVLKKDRMVAGAETIAGETGELTAGSQIQQVFIAEGEYLRFLDLYVAESNAGGQVCRLLLYDEENELLCDRELTVPETGLPGYWRIPTGIETVPGRAYVWQLKGAAKPLTLAFQNTGETGLTTFGNYYTIENSETVMHTAQNILMRTVYTDAPGTKRMVALFAGLAVMAAAIILPVEYLGIKRQKLRKEIRLQKILWVTIAPVFYVFLAYLIYAVYILNLFGGKADDKLVYGLAIGIAAIGFSYVLFAKRAIRPVLPVKRIIEQRGMDWLQSIAFAGVLMGCIHFMNAQFQFYQDCAYREVLLWTGLLLLTMCPPGQLFCRRSIGWLALAGIGSFAYYQYWLSGSTEEALLQEAVFVRYHIGIFLVAGLVVFAIYDRIRSRAFLQLRLNRFYAGLTAFLLLGLILFRNTRGWPVYLALVFGLFYAFYCSWDKKERLLSNLCNGIVLNFALATVFAVARRPYRAWVFSRYNFVFHTVTITATYLTLVISTLTVRLLAKRRSGKRIKEMWGTLLLYGMAAAFLFLTLSRTGYLAAIVMTLIIVPYVTFVCYREKCREFIAKILLMAAAVLCCLPLTYSAVRLLPALYNDPYIYEVEESAAAIHKDEPKDSTSYMSVSYFKYVMENKLLADAGQPRDKELLLQCLRRETYVRPGSVLVASAQDAGMAEAGDYSNGRLEIFGCYIKNWNLTGHDEMGVLLPDQTVSVHAHNTYLQVIHDHGLLVGAIYLIFGAVSGILMFIYAWKKAKEEPYAALPLAIFIGFAIASLVEWLFHPCNPLGFTTVAMCAPLLDFSRRRKVIGKKVLKKDAK